MAFLISVNYQGSMLEHTLQAGTLTIGRSPNANFRLPDEFILISGMHFELQTVLGNQHKLLIRDGFNGQPSTNGTLVNNSPISSKHWSDFTLGDKIRIGNNLDDFVDVLIIAIDREVYPNQTQEYSLDQKSWDIDKNLITIGRSSDCTVVVDESTVSRRHCSIKLVNGSAYLIDHSQNGIFVNQKPVNGQVKLESGDIIKIGASLFAYQPPSLIRTTDGEAYRIDVRDLWLPGRISGANLSIEPGQLVAFVGGSGAGKSSLLTTIVGQNMDYKGIIRINDLELKNSYPSFKQEIGFVPQDDIVHKDLSIEEVLSYSARLKLPDAPQRSIAVQRVLDELELSHRRKALVRELSGGQRKRVSIGVELIADPKILFLDEPTSGLDPGLDKRMMELLRRLADSGRTVALVTHATNNVMLCDQVIFLGRGGYVCYAGPPQFCSRHFGVDGDFSDIYQHLEKNNHEIAQIADQYKGLQIKSLPILKEDVRYSGPKSGILIDNPFRRFGTAIKQFRTILSRDLNLSFRDRTSLVLNSLTAPIAVLMISFAASNRSIFLPGQTTGFEDALRILFVIICATIWVALSTSLQSMVKERPIFRRERSFNLLPEAYVTSKFALMIIQALIQVALIVATVTMFFEAPQVELLNWPLAIAIVTLITLVTIGSQSLLISSLVSNSQQASSAAPLLLIPQLIFGGVLFNIKGESSGIYNFIASRWSMRTIGAFTDVTQLLPNGVNYEHSADYASTMQNVTDCLAVLGIQAVVLLIATYCSVYFVRHNR